MSTNNENAGAGSTFIETLRSTAAIFELMADSSLRSVTMMTDVMDAIASSADCMNKPHDWAAIFQRFELAKHAMHQTHGPLQSFAAQVAQIADEESA